MMTTLTTVHVYPQVHTTGVYQHLNPHKPPPIPIEELRLIVVNQYQIAGEILQNSQGDDFYFEEGRTTYEWSLLYSMKFQL